VADGSVAAGGGVALVRPESVRVDVDPDGAATVASVSFLGSISLVHCTFDDGTRVIAQSSSAHSAELSPGARVGIAVEQAEVLVVPSAMG
jgi:putative spermidine/putrescine transport system ATP-binding protein